MNAFKKYINFIKNCFTIYLPVAVIAVICIFAYDASQATGIKEALFGKKQIPTKESYSYNDEKWAEIEKFEVVSSHKGNKSLLVHYNNGKVETMSYDKLYNIVDLSVLDDMVPNLVIKNTYATHYGKKINGDVDKEHGRKTASGFVFDANKISGATFHNLGVAVITVMYKDYSLDIVVNDRMGDHSKNRCHQTIDLSAAAFQELTNQKLGVNDKVKVNFYLDYTKTKALHKALGLI